MRFRDDCEWLMPFYEDQDPNGPAHAFSDLSEPSDGGACAARCQSP